MKGFIAFVFFSLLCSMYGRAQGKTFDLKNHLSFSMGTSGYHFVGMHDDRKLIWPIAESGKHDYSFNGSTVIISIIDFIGMLPPVYYSDVDKSIRLQSNRYMSMSYTYDGKWYVSMYLEDFALGHKVNGTFPPPGRINARVGSLRSIALNRRITIKQRLFFHPEFGLAHRARGGEQRFGIIIPDEAIGWWRDYNDFGIKTSGKLVYYPFAKFELSASVSYLWFFYREYTGGDTYFYGLVDAGTPREMFMVSFGMGYAFKMPSFKRKKKDKTEVNP